MGPKGRVLMIDIDPVSEGLARRNIEQNNLQDRVQSMCCAIWSEDKALPPGTPERTFDRVRNTLVAIDEHPTWTVQQEVATRSLDSIFREANLDEIDFLNMQLNGAEYEALDGLNEYFDKTKVIYCAASFHAAGEPLNERLKKKFEARGCWVKINPDSVTAVTPRWRSAFKLGQ
jgi:FkbM family methyltransferase